MKKGIVAKSVVAITLSVAVMIVVYYFLLQFFYGLSEFTVVSYLVSITQFNVVEALINIIPAYLIYLRTAKSMEKVSRYWDQLTRNHAKFMYSQRDFQCIARNSGPLSMIWSGKPSVYRNGLITYRQTCSNSHGKEKQCLYLRIWKNSRMLAA